MCRSSGTQLALLDRIAGTSADARLFGARLQQLHSLREQLRAVEALGSEDARDQLQHLVDTVGSGCGSKQAALHWLCCPSSLPASILAGLIMV